MGLKVSTEPALALNPHIYLLQPCVAALGSASKQQTFADKQQCCLKPKGFRSYLLL